MQLLVIEDEKRLAEALKEILEEQKYFVDVVNNGLDGYEYASSGIYDCIVLDIMLPLMDGFTIVKKLRNEKIETPIIILTAKDSVSNKVDGLNIGADDYMTKPFSPLELVARIKSITRRKGEVVIDSIEYMNLAFNQSSSELSNINNQKSVHLNFKEAEIIATFFRRPEIVISKEDIITKVWGYDSDATDNNLEAYISFVRKKMAFLDAECEIISLKKIGYMLGKKK